MSSKQSAPFFYFITVVFVFIFGAKLFTKGLFVDGIFYGALQNILTYFRSIGNVPLQHNELTTNAAMRSSRMPIEKFYAHKDNMWNVCAHTAGHLAKAHPYAIEQLRLVYLLTNCFNCFNGDQGGSVNTFGLTPPRIEDYLAL